MTSNVTLKDERGSVMASTKLNSIASVKGMTLALDLLALVRARKIKTQTFEHMHETYTLNASLIAVPKTAKNKLQEYNRLRGHADVTVPESDHTLHIDLNKLQLSRVLNASGQEVKGSKKSSKYFERIIRDSSVFFNGTEYSLKVTLRKSNPDYDSVNGQKSPSTILAECALQDARMISTLEAKIKSLQKELNEVKGHADKMSISATALASSEKQ